MVEGNSYGRDDLISFGIFEGERNSGREKNGKKEVNPSSRDSPMLGYESLRESITVIGFRFHKDRNMLQW